MIYTLGNGRYSKSCGKIDYQWIAFLNMSSVIDTENIIFCFERFLISNLIQSNIKFLWREEEKTGDRKPTFIEHNIPVKTEMYHSSLTIVTDCLRGLSVGFPRKPKLWKTTSKFLFCCHNKLQLKDCEK